MTRGIPWGSFYFSRRGRAGVHDTRRSTVQKPVLESLWRVLPLFGRGVMFLENTVNLFLAETVFDQFSERLVGESRVGDFLVANPDSWVEVRPHFFNFLLDVLLEKPLHVGIT